MQSTNVRGIHIVSHNFISKCVLCLLAGLPTHTLTWWWHRVWYGNPPHQQDP